MPDLPPTPISRRLFALQLAGLATLARAEATTAPDFTLRAIDGRNLRLAEQRGKVVLVNFWATWCPPCRVEMPHLNRIYDKYRDSGFVMLAVNVDQEPAKATSAAGAMGVRAPVLLDTDKTVVRRFNVAKMPTTLLIDRDGRMRFTHQGYRDGVELTYEKQVRDLLKE